MLSNTVAMDFGRAIFGSVGAVVFSVVVAVSSFGALSGLPTRHHTSTSDAT